MAGQFPSALHHLQDRSGRPVSPGKNCQKNRNQLHPGYAYRYWLSSAESTPGTQPDFLFNAHLDVVPVIHEGQTNPVLKNGELHARGAYDCLGSVACIAEILADSVGKFNASAFFTVDEEQGGALRKP
ncbi:MAG: M20/M25/M40 family metallo-hydrolase [Lentisphaeria bacterium]|nr:M20/M25/M40 family metallo-hydrolase [Lentisphaeria bacterium]